MGPIDYSRQPSGVAPRPIEPVPQAFKSVTGRSHATDRKMAPRSEQERFSFRWTHLTKESLQFKELQHVLIEKADQVFRNMHSFGRPDMSCDRTSQKRSLVELARLLVRRIDQPQTRSRP
jgi:hypothetical protein